MKLTLVSHFYNEEYLLPHWLNHHKKYFTHGIMINYKSTDSSVDIIKEICPTWDIVDSKNEHFVAQPTDLEVMEYEKNITGFKICLNTTEFLIGDYQILENISEPTQFCIPSYTMVDSPETAFTEIEGDLISNRTYGFGYHGNLFIERMSRSLHNFNVNYPIGRHFFNITTDKFVILFYRYSPYNQQFIKRKLQIQHKMTDSDFSRNIGIHHKLNIDMLNDQFVKYQSISKDLNSEIKKYLEL